MLLAQFVTMVYQTLPPALPVPAKDATFILLTFPAVVSIMVSVPKRIQPPGTIL